MASWNDGLVLALPLDDARQAQDASGKNNNGMLNGAFTLAPDDLFGACLKFTGANTQIVVADHPSLRLTSDLTLSVWVYLDPVVSDWVRVLGKGDLTNRNYGLWYHAPLKQWLFQQYGPGTTLDVSGNIGEIKANTWYHLAAVRQGSNAFLYLNGAQIGASTSVTGTPYTNADPLTLGYAGHHAAHQGLLARARVYNRALSGEEIKALLQQDRLALPAFRKSHPVDFNLYDDHNQFVLYIDDEPAGHRLHLELHNTSAKDLQLAKTSDTASATNHHFELRFRSGTLSSKTLDLLKDAASKTKVLGNATTEWDYFMPATNLGEAVSFYLLYKGSETLFKPNAKRRVTFAHISASATGGSRGTQVEMRPHQLTFVNATTLITGSRVQALHITNQRGLKNIPLHVAFIGSNRILNDQGVSSSELKLQLMNIMRPHAEHLNNPKISLRVADSSKGISASQLIVTFEVQDTGQARPWALCQASELNQFTLGAEIMRQVRDGQGVLRETREIDIFTIAPSASALGESRQWTLTSKKNLDLNPGDYLLLTLAGLKSSLPSGLANLYLHYENIPGYWEGQFTCQVEKAPLLYAGGNVGIGTSAPAEALQLSNFADGDRYVKLTAAGGHRFRVGLKLMVYQENFGFTIENDDRRESYGLNILRNQFDVATSMLFIQRADGNVGIGTTAPTNRLQINNVYHGSAGYGLTVAQETYGANIQIKRRAGEGGIGLVVDNNEAGDASTLLFLVRNNLKAYPNNQNHFVIRADGKVGIGTSAPNEMLEVNGNMKFSGWGRTIQFIDDRAAGGEITKGTVGAVSYVDMQIGFPGPAFGGKLLLGRWTTSNPSKFEELMRVQSDGNVGIGTPTPLGRLDVAGWYIIMRKFANDGEASNLLNQLPNGSLIFGGPWSNGIYFYWKDEAGRRYRKILPGDPW